MTCSPVFLPGNSEAYAGGGFGWTGAPQIEVVSKCPPRVQYKEEFLKQSGVEVGSLLKANRSSPTVIMLNDYRKLRRGCDGIEQK